MQEAHTEAHETQKLKVKAWPGSGVSEGCGRGDFKAGAGAATATELLEMLPACVTVTTNQSRGTSQGRTRAGGTLRGPSSARRRIGIGKIIRRLHKRTEAR